MIRKVLALGMALALTFGFAGTTLAAAGGMPEAHGAYGSDFGAAVSSTAQISPGALAEHTSGGRAGGMPGAHGVDGAAFGGAVSGLAQSSPGAIAGHVSGK